MAMIGTTMAWIDLGSRYRRLSDDDKAGKADLQDPGESICEVARHLAEI